MAQKVSLQHPHHLVKHPVPIHSPDTTPLPLYDPTTPRRFDLVIAGAGPSGLSVAERVSSAGLSVCIVDPNPLAYWPNNYGVWCDEFEAMGLDDCYEIVWPRAKVFLGSEKDDEKYGRGGLGVFVVVFFFGGVLCDMMLVNLVALHTHHPLQHLLIHPTLTHSHHPIIITITITPPHQVLVSTLCTC